ncbi:MAG: Uncharacterised protein [Methanobacteriota archaeon]|nr:MAG: Uncharacterised protein [Euryarchaeota archaeon]
MNTSKATATAKGCCDSSILGINKMYEAADAEIKTANVPKRRNKIRTLFGLALLLLLPTN